MKQPAPTTPTKRRAVVTAERVSSKPPLQPPLPPCPLPHRIEDELSFCSLQRRLPCLTAVELAAEETQSESDGTASEADIAFLEGVWAIE